MYRLVLFDLDGTLLDSDGVIVATFLELYKKYRPNYVATFEHMLTFSGPPIAETLKNEFPNVDQKLVLNDFINLSFENYVKYAKLFPGVKPLFLELRKNKIPFGLVTSKSRHATDYVFQILGIEGYFDFSITGDEVSHTKPSPEGIYLAMEHFSIKNPKNVLYIGDGYIDYLTAKAANVGFGLVSFSPRKDKIPSEEVDVVINDFSDVLKVMDYEKD